MSTHDAWLKFYVGDYLADTGHLTTVEHGAYVLLLFHSWRTGPLPEDAHRLAAIARLPREAWQEVSPTILAFFTRTPKGLIQKRLEAVRSVEGRKIEQRREAGRASAAQRSANGKGNGVSNENPTTVERPSERNEQSRTRESESESDRENPHGATPPVDTRGRATETRAAARARGCRLPEEWDPGDKGRAFAREKGLDPGATLQMFRDYWRASAAPTARKMDWDAAWRVWCGKAQGFPDGRAAPRSTRRPSGAYELFREEAGDLPAEETDELFPIEEGARNGRH